MVALIILSIFAIAVIYAHSRGVEKQKFSRQLFDHSTFMAPVNMFMTGFSTLPAKQPYFDPAEFPELQQITDNWQAIRDEALQLQDHIKASNNHQDAGFNTFFKRGWKGLMTPNDDRCFIEVDRQRHSWRDGEAVLFDETYVHWAQNDTGRTRIILFCDIERPMKWRWAQAVNHWVGSTLLSAASSPNDENDRVGGINRIFKYVNSLRDAGQRLKKRNRKLYYWVKHSLIVLLFAIVIVPSVIL
ncbi:aspartyl/asparaginyl beta-hydroxylase domain-containing protein [Erwinia sp. SLM-02]|uniref:aspartyl/asparaginyl beta-hydroxylase domain-containing protein n=1 Tax=Erwinia sp. SLM-02 TaxID=3020057 RepID=UPI0030800E26